MELAYTEGALLCRLANDFNTLDEVKVLSEEAPFSNYNYNIALKCIRQSLAENEGESKRVIKRRWFDLYYIQTSVKGVELQKELKQYASYSDTKTEAIEKNFMEYYCLRKLSALGGLLTNCMNDELISSDHISHINTVVTQLDDATIQEGEITNKDCHRALIEKMQRKLEGNEDAISSGLYELDKIIGGFIKKRIYLIGARTSMGKTALALTFMDHFVFSLGMKCAFISVEMTEADLYERMVQIRSGYNFDESFSKSSMNTFLETSDQMQKNENLIIKKTTDRRIGNVKSMCRRLKRDNPDLEVIFVDYIQKVLSNDPKKEMVGTIEEVSGVLTDIADDLDVVMMPLAQLKRQQDPKAFPALEGLKGAGRLEEDASMVMLLHRDSRSAEEGVIIVDKNRSGPTGIAQIQYNTSITKFSSQIDAGYEYN